MTLLATAALLLLLQAPPQAAKASIEGYVVRVGTNEPISRARVIATNTEGTQVPEVTTDSQGHFVIKDLDPGSYSLVAQRNGFARQTYGERRPGREGTPLAVIAGQELKDVVFRLIPTGAVSGRISDAGGEAIPGMSVQVLKSVYGENGRRRFDVVASGSTDDRGEYRLFALTPGRYYVQALPDTAAAASSFFRNLVIEPGLVRTFYPGTTEPSAAVAIELEPGAELRTIDFTVSRERLFRVRGRTFDPRLGKAPEQVTIEITPRTAELSAFSAQIDSQRSANGAFEIRNVPPGSYWISATQFDIRGPGPLGPENFRVTVTRYPIDVSNSDIENVMLTFSPGFTIPGRISFDDGGPLTRLPDLNELAIALEPKDDSVPPFPSFIKTDGTFNLENTQPGDYRLSFSFPSNYYVKSARLGNIDALNGLTITSRVSGGLEVVLSANAAQLEGTVVDKDRKPVASAQVVLIPDRLRDRHDLYKQTISDQNGHFAMSAVVPGDYKLFAWEDIEPFSYNDPDLLRKYEALGAAVKVAESAKLTLEAKIIPPAQ